MHLVDTHIHLDLYKDEDQVIQRAQAAGVKSIITMGLDPKSNRAALLLSLKYPLVEAALGIYPPSALQQEYTEEGNVLKTFDIDKELKFIRSKQREMRAIGEVGLDYKMTDEREQQHDLFQKFMTLAKDIEKPLSIHSRKAEHTVVDFLIDAKMNPSLVVLHCFGGKKNLIKQAIDMGYAFSIPANCVRSEHFQMLIDLCPLKQLLTETDGPYLSPFPDTQNEPAFVMETIKVMAKIKEMEIIDIANNIFMNYQRIFL